MSDPVAGAVEGYTEAELASLSPEERASIGAEIPEEHLPSRIVDDSVAVETAREMQAKAVADKAAQATEAARTEAAAKASAEHKPSPVVAAAVADPVVTAPVVDPAPVVAAPDPFVSKFQAKYIPDADFEAAQSALAKRFEDGEITTPQFMVENGKLERAKIEGDIAHKQTEQSAEQLWQHQQDQWFAQTGNEVIRDDPRVWAAMQAQLEGMYADPAKVNYTNLKFLEEAGAEVKKLFGLSAPVKAVATEPKKNAIAAAELPETLAQVPAAADNQDGKGEFDYMDSMNGMNYEVAVARMNPEQKARFLEAR